MKPDATYELEDLKRRAERSRKWNMVTLLFALVLIVAVAVVLDRTQISLLQSATLATLVALVSLSLAALAMINTRRSERKLKRLLGEMRDKQLALQYSQEELIRQLEDAVNLTQTVRALIDEKRFAEAEEIAAAEWKQNSDDSSVLETYIGVLLAYNDRKKCEKAWNILKENAINNSSHYIRLAYLFWEFGELSMAIEVAEQALSTAQTRAADRDAMNRIRNSLAYYYAESGKEEYEDSARSLIEEFTAEELESPNRLDTKGYIKIVFGKTKEEVYEGMDLCLAAYKADNNHFKNLYENHTKRAIERVQTFSTS